MPGRVRRPPERGLAVVVVIPCHDEPAVLETLADLRRCADPGCPVEIIVVINASETASDEVRARNAESLRNIEAWSAKCCDDARFRVHAVDYPRLPARHAGVGLARKLGMDEALARILEADGEDGIIVSLDADCRVDENYLESIARHFAQNPASPACSIHFEHPLEGPLGKMHYRAITEYELYLRYYRHGLLRAGHPCAHYTVGSCMAVRASGYARQGGMNRRKGAEDFYFLNKLMLIGGFTEVRDTTVRPAARPSHRVPFGTGRAISDALAASSPPLKVCVPRVFDDLAALFERIDRLRSDPAAVFPELSVAMNDYLSANGVHDKLEEMAGNAATATSYRARFFRWFDGFRAFKFVRFASDRVYGRMPVDRAALDLLRRRHPEELTAKPSARELLLLYRRLDRAGGRSSRMPRASR